MSPQRIQLSRKKGWRKPVGAIVVARPSKWGNPFRLVASGEGWQVTGSSAFIWCREKKDAAAEACEMFENLYIAAAIGLGVVRSELAGHDLACWCPLDQPCHGDNLLELANAPTQEVTT